MTTTFDGANDAFFADFIKCISTEPEPESDNKSPLCLITNEPLEKYSVRLNCGHSFNYAPLLNAIQQYKHDQLQTTKTNNMNTHCPYCREMTIGVLPYAPGFEKKLYINTPHTLCIGTNACKHILTNKSECGRRCYYNKCHLHIEKPDVIKCNGITRAGVPCKNNATSVEIYCKLHRK